MADFIEEELSYLVAIGIVRNLAEKEAWRILIEIVNAHDFPGYTAHLSAGPAPGGGSYKVTLVSGDPLWEFASICVDVGLMVQHNLAAVPDEYLNHLRRGFEYADGTGLDKHHSFSVVLDELRRLSP
ncbi:MAG TPA: hypothetical protein HPQ04_04465 [Rhodospirillaceae bacterium]|nr:hypothetical protein [Rhodospirillaceae bacterium]